MANASPGKMKPMEQVLENDLLQDLSGGDAIDQELNIDNVKRKNLREVEMLQILAVASLIVTECMEKSYQRSL